MSEFQNTPDAFARQLREGHYNELRVALYFMLQGCLTRIALVEGRYDIEVKPLNAPTFHVEVKWDKMAAQTGNLYFEVENTRQRRPSGILATTATRWCQVVGDGQRAFLVEVSRLKAILQAGNFRSVTTSGADSNSRGLIVPQRLLERQEGVSVVQLPTVEEFFGAVFRSGRSS